MDMAHFFSFFFFMFLGVFGLNSLATPGGAQGFFLFGSVLRDHSWSYSRDQMWFQELNLGQQRIKQVP